MPSDRSPLQELLGDSEWQLVDGRWSLPLDGPGQVLVVLEGAVQVMNLVDRVSEAAPGARRPLLTLRSGEAGFALPEAVDALSGRRGRLLAVGTRPGTRVVLLSLAQFTPDLSIPARELLGTWLDDWLSRVAAASALSALPDRSETVTAEGELVIDAATPLLAVSGLWWLMLLAGEASGMDGSACHPGGLPHAVSASDGLMVAGAARFEVQRSETLLAQDQLWTAFEQHAAGLAARLLQAGCSQLAREQQRLQATHQHDQSLVADSLQSMVAVHQVVKHAVGVNGEGARLWWACSRVAEHLGVPLGAPPKQALGGDVAVMMDQIASHACIRVRPVGLGAGWWRADQGPLVATRQSDGMALALIPQRGGYRALDPHSGSDTLVDAAFAASLQPRTWALCRPLPDHPLARRDLFNFVMRNVRLDLAMLLLISVLSALLALITPLATGVLFESIVPLSARGEVFQIVAAIVAASLGAASFEIVRGFCNLRAGTRISAELGAAIWDRTLKLPLTFFRNFTSGDMTQRVYSISEIRELLEGGTITKLFAGFGCVSSLFLMFWYDGLLAAVALLVLLFQLAVVLYGSLRQSLILREILSLRGQVLGLVLQLANGMESLRSFGAEKRAFSTWAKGAAEEMTLDRRRQSIGVSLSSFRAGFVLLGPLLIYITAVFSERELELGTFVAFSAAFGLLSSQLDSLLEVLETVLTVGSHLERAKPIIEAVPEVDRDKVHPGVLGGHVEINQLIFRYQAHATPILQGVSIVARPGEFIALVGASGAGKTTLLRLITGFEKPESGAIFYDGKDLAGLRIDEIRRRIGLVMQSGQLTSGTIFSNIVGTAPYSEEDAWEAVRAVGLDAEIAAMPQGMQTVLLGGDASLSGGQRQRLMIARALVRRPRIMLLDEATSALDNRAQAIVADSLARMNVTRIVISQRLSTVQHADCIYVLADGEIREQGRYDELMARKGIFAELARSQNT
ncbi:MAG: NHLP bacteriocin export ABC transporter permease/ATPase subunit [Pseudomonadota bacterium]